MPVTAQELREQRLRCDEQILATLDAHNSRLENAKTDALAALDAAQESLRVIENDLSDVKTRRAAVAKRVEGARGRRRRRPMDTFPLELLRAVFLELALPPNNLWPSDDHGSVDEVRVRLPFDLAAVCMRWRDLALATPTLWTYIGVPAPGSRPERRTYYYVYWVKTLLHRSKTAALYICLPWAQDSPWEPDSYSARIVDTLAAHSLRWRHFEYWVPPGPLTWDMMALFRRPVPILESFCLIGQRDESGLSPEPGARFPRYLPECSNLGYFRSDYANIIYALPRQPMNSLRTLELFISDIRCRVIWDMLRVTPDLEELDVQFSSDSPDDVEVPPEAPIHLAQLRLLTIFGDACLMFATAVNSIAIPALHQIKTDPAGLRDLQPFFLACAPSLAAMRICDDPLEMEHAAFFQPLKRLEKLWILDCVVQDEFLQALAVPDDWILPRLECIAFGSGVKIEPEDGDGLAHLVRVRNIAAEGSAGAAPSRIRSVVIEDSPEIPEWLIAEVRYLLAEEVVAPVDTDSPAIEDAASSSGEEEPEAEFSDLGSESDGSESSFVLTSEDGSDGRTSRGGGQDEESSGSDE